MLQGIGVVRRVEVVVAFGYRNVDDLNTEAASSEQTGRDLVGLVPQKVARPGCVAGSKNSGLKVAFGEVGQRRFATALL